MCDPYGLMDSHLKVKEIIDEGLEYPESNRVSQAWLQEEGISCMITKGMSTHPVEQRHSQYTISFHSSIQSYLMKTLVSSSLVGDGTRSGTGASALQFHLAFTVGLSMASQNLLSEALHFHHLMCSSSEVPVY